MFERKKYKSFAKTQLSGRWGIPILVTLFVTIITRIFSIPDILQLSNKGYFTVLLAGDFREAYSIYTSPSLCNHNLGCSNRFVNCLQKTAF